MFCVDFTGMYKIRHCSHFLSNVGSLVLTAVVLISFSVHPSTVKMEAKCSSEVPVDLQRATSHYITEDKAS
jgi:hypothetical protein